jgi:ACR3 family arsenite transporter
MSLGIAIGKYLPIIPRTLEKFTYAEVSIPIAILVWLMIYPMMLKVDLKSIKNIRNNPQGLIISWITSWLIKPFLMFGLAILFFNFFFRSFISPELAQQYIAGAVLLGAAPCTAMVFVWSSLTKGDPAYTLLQVATNDLIILVAFVPIVSFLLGINNIQVPWTTLALSVILFVVIPLAGGSISRYVVVKNKGIDYFNNTFIPKFTNTTIGGLLLTLIVIFTYQGKIILENPFHIILISIPLIIQNLITFSFAYSISRIFKMPHSIAAPAGLIGASDFFELSVAVAITLFGPTSPVVLVTTVGVLTEVPVMLLLVKFTNNTRHWFPAKKSVIPQ